MRITRITNKHFKLLQLHSMPTADPDLKHILSLLCKCQPNIMKVGNGVTVRHQMLGNGPDEWTVRVRKPQAKEEGGAL